MAATAAIPERSAETFQQGRYPVGAGQTLYQGTFAGFLAGYVVSAETVGAENFAIVMKTVDNSGGGDGDQSVNLQFNELKPVRLVKNDTVAPVAQAQIGVTGGVFWKDNETVSSDGTGRPVAGTAWEIESPTGLSQRDGVRVEFA